MALVPTLHIMLFTNINRKIIYLKVILWLTYALRASQPVQFCPFWMVYWLYGRD